MAINLDQHNMTDAAMVRKVAEAANIGPEETLLEVGSGSGNLTRELAKRAGRVIAVEIDPEFEESLEGMDNVDIIMGNVLEEMEKLQFDKIVSNIPYAICEPLIHRLLGKDFSLAVLTVPRGFAEILGAGRKEDKRSKLSAIGQAVFDVDILFEIPRESFHPKPKTDSVALRITPRKGHNIQREVLKRDKLKTKNAIIRALFAVHGMTKNQSRKAIKTLGINNDIMEKQLSDVNLDELDIVLQSLKNMKKVL